MKVSGMIGVRNTTEIKAQTLNQRKHTPNRSILKGLTAAVSHSQPTQRSNHTRDIMNLQHDTLWHMQTHS